ncbi:MAG: hypothetical protein Q8K89_04080 [Actinomycetota bacterium]|nr:hypothetical protein [Actinomycetota bacterium]
MPPEPAKELASRVATDIVAGDVDDLYPLLHPVSRQSMTQQQLTELLDKIEDFAGRPLEATGKSRGTGTMTGTWGTRPVVKFWFDLRTTKAEPGEYVLQVDVVADDGEVSCSQFSVRTRLGELAPGEK